MYKMAKKIYLKTKKSYKTLKEIQKILFRCTFPSKNVQNNFNRKKAFSEMITIVGNAPPRESNGKNHISIEQSKII